jgi:outer membrane protein OmpA-like peptidoglycan-associated protein
MDQVLRTLTANPRVWSQTVLVITHDESSWFFDHVAPPVAPPGTSGEYVTARPAPGATQGFLGPVGLGFRVPALIISPFSRGGYVCSEIFDHISQIRLLEDRFGIKCPNILTWRRATIASLSATLRMSSADTSLVTLPITTNYPSTLYTVQGCSAQDVAEINTSQPPYPLGSSQSMPTQERGTLRRVGSFPAVTLTFGRFSPNSATLTTTLKTQVAAAAKDVKSDGFRRMTLTGFSDASASTAQSLAVSRRRASNVERYLQAQVKILGVSGIAITIVARGRASPIASNSTAGGRAKNRRVVATLS